MKSRAPLVIGYTKDGRLIESISFPMKQSEAENLAAQEGGSAFYNSQITPLRPGDAIKIWQVDFFVEELPVQEGDNDMLSPRGRQSIFAGSTDRYRGVAQW